MVKFKYLFTQALEYPEAPTSEQPGKQRSCQGQSDHMVSFSAALEDDAMDLPSTQVYYTDQMMLCL